MIGASLAAFAAASAGAQTTFVGTNRSEILQRGPGNIATVINGASANDDNFSRVIQDGANNRATIEQIGDFNDSFADQQGNDNSLAHRQTGDDNVADSHQTGDTHASSIAQSGDGNRARATQAGDRNRSIINQAAAGSFVDDSDADVRQRGSDNVSELNQLGSRNEAFVIQGASRLASDGARSSITQRQSGHVAEVFQFDGSSTARNLSSIVQENRITGGADFLSDNLASISIRGFGNESAVTQNGDDLIASVSIVGGATASGGPIDPESGRSDGNRSFVAQTGRGLTAFVSAGSLRNLPGRGNLNNIEQTSNAYSGDARPGHKALVWQRGFHETNLIRQSDGSATRPVQQPITYRDGSRGHAVADVSQSGERNSVEVLQFADNFARVTQGLGSRSRTRIEQVDAGDYEVSIAAVPGSSLRAFNRADVAQYGDDNAIDIAQDSVGAAAIVFQRRGSSFNSAAIAQGVRGTETQDPGNPAPTGSETFNLAADVTQGGTRNIADVGQWGIFIQALVDQSGSGTAALPNRVLIRQRGRGNLAAAQQSANVGPSAAGDAASGQSGDEFFFTGGARSAEIVILQSDIGNNAAVTQRGRGQLGRVEQTGPRNRAWILQEAGATNASAIIRQSGSDNSYSVTQTQPGQYILVRQSGNNNAVTDVVRRGPGS